MMESREKFIEVAKNNSLYWAERSYETNGDSVLTYTMLLQWAMGDEFFGEQWDNWKRKQNDS
jgi:hypothetical protein